MRKQLVSTFLAALFLAACSSSSTAAEEPSTSVPESLALAEETTTTSTEPPLDMIEADELVAAINQIGMASSTIVHDVRGEFEGHEYSTTETVTSDPETGISHVSVNFEEFSVLLDDLVARSLEADEASGAFEQSFGTTAFLVASLSNDSGEYFVEGDTLWLESTTTPAFQLAVESVNSILAEYGEPAADTSNLTARLEGTWFREPGYENQQPIFLGRGPLLTVFLQSLLGGPEATLQIIDQEVTADGLIVNAELAELGPVVFELDGATAIRSIQYEAASFLLGVEEQNTYTISDVSDPSILELPTASVIEEEAFFEALEGELLAVVPQEIIDAEQGTDDAQRAEIEAELNR